MRLTNLLRRSEPTPPRREWGERFNHDSEAFWQRIAERDRRARIRAAERRKELIKQAVREVLDEREPRS